MRNHEEQLVHDAYLHRVLEMFRLIPLLVDAPQRLSFSALPLPLCLYTTVLDEPEKQDKRSTTSKDSNSDPEKSEGRQYGEPVQVGSIAEALQRSPQSRMVVLGRPGSGKTTALALLMVLSAQKALEQPGALLPVFLSLPDLARLRSPLRAYLTSLQQRMGLEVAPDDWLWQTIMRGQALLCLDSLDEVPPQQRPAILRLINEQEALAGNAWIIGSRFAQYKGGQFGSDFTEWNLLPLDENLCMTFAQCLLPLLEDHLPAGEGSDHHQAATSFVRELETHPRVASWGENPLLFSLAAAIFARTGTLSSNQAMLYHEVTWSLLTRGEPDVTQREQVYSVLAAVALQLYQKKGHLFSGTDLENEVITYQSVWHARWRAADIIRGIQSSGLLNTVAPHTYSFLHQTFQEFLAAHALSHSLLSEQETMHEQTWEFAWSKRTFSRWTEILRLLVSVLVLRGGQRGRDLAERWLRALLAQQAGPQGDVGNLGLALVVVSLADVVALADWQRREDASLERDVAQQWAKQALALARREPPVALQRLLNIGKQIARFPVETLQLAVKLLEQALRGEDWQLQKTAIALLGLLGTSEANTLLLAMLKSNQEGTRLATAEALAQESSSALLEHLFSLLDQRGFDVEKYKIANLLEQYGAVMPTERLVSLLQHQCPREENDRYYPPRGCSWIRDVAAKLLKKKQAEVPAAVWTTALYDGTTSSIAGEFLGTMGKQAPIDAIVNALRDQNASVRNGAVIALEKLGSLAPLKPLLAALSDTDYNINQRVRNALVQRSKELPLEPLFTMLEGPSAEGRKTALLVLGRLGSRVPLEPLLAALHDSDNYVRYCALWAIGEQGDRVSIKEVMKCLDDPYLWNRVRALTLLGQRGDQVPLDIFLAALQSPEERVREEAVNILATRKEQHVRTQLFAALHDPSYLVSQAAIQALVKLWDRPLVEELLALLCQQDLIYTKHELVLRTFGERVEHLTVEAGSPHAAEHLTLFFGLHREFVQILVDLILESTYQGARDEAQRTLGILGKHPVFATLVMEVVEQRYWPLRKLAIEVLDVYVYREELTSPEPLLLALQDQSWQVREAAVTSLGKLKEQCPVGAIVALLTDDTRQVREAAVRALASLQERTPLEPLLYCLRDKDNNVRKRALETLGMLKEHMPVDEIVAVLLDEHEEDEVIIAAVQALGWLGEQMPVDALLTVLQRKRGASDEVETALFEVLGKAGEYRPVEALLEALKDYNAPYVEATLIRALGKQFPTYRLLSAIEYMDDWDYDPVATAATEVLIALGKEAPVEALEELYQQNDRKTIRETIRKILGELDRGSILEGEGEKR